MGNQLSNLHAKFAGGIPENYDRYLRPLLFEPCARDLADRIGKSGPVRFLELACGTGVVTAQLLSRLDPQGTIVATDLNPDMIEVARKRLPSDRITWQVADATSLPFGSGSADVVICQFGWMFFPDKAKAMREAHRVLAPRGQLLFNVWDKIERNESGELAKSLYQRELGADAPTFFTIPYGMHDVAPTMTMLTEAGFTDANVEHVELTGRSPSPRHAAMGWLDGSPVLNEIILRRPDAISDLREKLTQAMAERFGDGPFESKLSAIVFSATKR